MEGKISLSKREKRLISCVQLQGDLTFADLGKQISCREHTARYELLGLVERGVLVRHGVVDTFRLGYLEYDYYLSLGLEHRDLREKFLKTVLADPKVSWFIEIGGEYEYAIGITARSAQEAHDVLERLSNQFGRLFSVRDYAISLRWSYFRRKYLSPKDERVNEMHCGPLRKIEETDSLDRLILASLMKSGTSTEREIARELQISPSTLNHRVQSLKKRGLFWGYVYGVNAQSYGMQIFRLHLRLRSIRTGLFDKIYRYAYAHSNIVTFVPTTGHWDLSLRTEVVDPREILQIHDELWERFGPDILEIRTVPVLGEKKVAF